jgi:hypothetical protein
MITTDIVPDADQVGFIVPSLFRKSRYKTLDKLFTINIHNGFYKLLPTNDICDAYFIKHHGENAYKLWLWMLEQLDLKWTLNKYNVFYCNCWITNRETFIEFLTFVKKVILLFDNAPQHIKELLNTDPNYKGKLIGTGILEKRFGKPHYPWQPFILERVVCLFDYIKETTQNSTAL